METEKSLWLEAYQQTLDAYVKGNHKIIVSQCAKCKVSGRTVDTASYDCELCSESAHSDMWISCLNRNCRPNDSKSMNEEETRNKIQYHEEAVSYLNSVQEFNMEDFKKELVRIDKQFE